MKKPFGQKSSNRQIAMQLNVLFEHDNYYVISDLILDKLQEIDGMIFASIKLDTSEEFE